MVVTMTALLRAWADDPAVGAILLDGAGGRAFAAGGDIRALYDAAKAGDKKLPEKFWATEYRLNVLIARYPKPVIALMDGVVMGGGVGLSAHASHRIVTERSSVAMPEVAIGYFPDVGACFLLGARAGICRNLSRADRRARGCGRRHLLRPRRPAHSGGAAGRASGGAGRLPRPPRRQGAARQILERRPRPAASPRRGFGSIAAMARTASRRFSNGWRDPTKTRRARRSKP